MVAIDTNVLLRYLLNDDKSQAEKAARIIDSQDTVLITDVVLVETLWTLKGKKYKASKADLCQVLDRLFKEPGIRFENDQVVWRAYKNFMNAGTIRKNGKNKQADFPDALIISKASYIAESEKNELAGVYTFDEAAWELKGALEPG